MKISTKPKCFECILPAAKDGYCRGHWDFLFGGMNNHDRMLEKKKLRDIRREFRRVPAGQVGS